ncbi:APOBEC N domain containing protein [Trichuris trichiura]|uniref:APOBEC N domain containing protein n=1 Tax=Trichuris trichiura TaxID=36087 RepID=A0A077Z854_TRITR|nr:APOBEC N domain containing protein [Trichuris trichiura]
MDYLEDRTESHRSNDSKQSYGLSDSHLENLTTNYQMEITTCTCEALPLSMTSVKTASWICNNDACKCRKYGEACHNGCYCQKLPNDEDGITSSKLGAICKNKRIALMITPSANNINSQAALVAEKKEQTAARCKCNHGSSRKRCIQSGKCECRRAFKVCSKQLCRCHASCTNNEEHQMIKGSLFYADIARKLFMQPYRGSSKALVAQLTTETATYSRAFVVSEKETRIHVEQKFYHQLMDAIANFTMPLREVILYLPTSPCFHQDCDPLCDVLDHCTVNIACAEALSICYKQIRSRTGREELQMTVKFLASYVRRGDLYTKQGIMSMMEAGLTVEPLNMKDWISLVSTADDNVSPEDIAKNRGTHIAYYRDLWENSNLADYVMQTQLYINECREEFGMKTLAWDGPLHSFLRDCIINSTRACKNYDQMKHLLNKKLAKEARKSRYRSGGTVWSRRRSQSVESSLSRSSRLLASSSCGSTIITTTTDRCADHPLTRSSGQHDEYGTTGFGNLQQNYDQRLQIVQSRNSLTDRQSQQNFGLQSVSVIQDSHGSKMTDAEIQQLLVNLSGRSIDEQEAREIREEVMKGIEEISSRIANLMTFIRRTIDSTAL